MSDPGASVSFEVPPPIAPPPPSDLPDRIGILKSVGYSDTEISDWSGRARNVLAAGGYSQPEIDSYLGENPRPIPAPLFDRMVSGSKSQPETHPSLLGELSRGVARGGTSLVLTLEDLANRVEHGIASATGSEAIKQTAEADTAALAQIRSETEAALQSGIPTIGDIGDVGDAAHYTMGKIGEVIPAIAEYAYLGVPRMVILGAAGGALRAAEQHNGDPAATALGAGIGAAMAGAPAPFLAGAVGKGMIQNIARGMLGVGVANLAGTVAEQTGLPLVAGEGLKLPSVGQLAESAASGLIAGAVFGGVGGLRTYRRGLTGTMDNVGIGSVPTPDDFRASGASIAGPNVGPAIVPKLHQLYDEYGIHPAEVAHDATRDVTITQDLISQRPELPSAYRPAIQTATPPAAPGPPVQPQPLPTPIPISATNVPGELPIRRFQRDAAAIEAALPPVEDGALRLWRGNRPGEIGTARQFTNDLPGIALPFREPYGGSISYVDVPIADAAKYESQSGAAPGAEFLLPPEIGAQAHEVRVTPGEPTQLPAAASASDMRVLPPQAPEGPLAAALPEEAPDAFRAPQPGTQPVGMGLGAPKPEPTPAEAKILSHISIGERPERQPWRWSQLYTEVWDNLNAIPSRDWDGTFLEPSKNPYILMRNLAGDPGKARHWTELGQVDYKTKAVIGPSLNKILKPVHDNLDPLRAFSSSLYALELEKRGIKTGFDLDAARTVVKDGIDKYGPIAAGLIQYQNNLAKYLRDAGVLNDKGYESMVDMNRFHVPFNVVFEEAPSSGGTGGPSLQPVNPIKRILGSERTKIDPIESIIKNTYILVSQAERNKASTALVDLLKRKPKNLKAAIEPAADNIDAAVTADAETFLKENGQDKSLADYLSNAVPPREGQIRVFNNGKAETWEVGDEIANAVKGLDARSAAFLAQWMHSPSMVQRTISKGLVGPARLLRAGATFSPDFALRNPVKDYFSAVVQSSKPLFTPWDELKGLYSAVVKDPLFGKWLMGGGGNSELVSLDRRYLQENIRKINRDTGLLNRAWNLARHPVDALNIIGALRTISEKGEQATRLGEFRYKYKKNIEAGMSEDDAITDAAYASREVTIDFQRRGAALQSMNLITAFFNSQLQGPDRLARAIIDNPLRTGFHLAAGVTLPSVLLWLYNHDDPRVKELPPWQRDLYYIVPTDHWMETGQTTREKDSEKPFPYKGTSARYRNGKVEINDGTIFRLPRGYETGIIFGSAVTRLLDKFIEHDPKAFDGLASSIFSALVPGVVPTISLPFVEQYANRSMFTDRNLIPPSLEGQAPEYQYTPYNTELTKAIGSTIAAFPGMREYSLGKNPFSGVARALTSPILIEEYTRAWTGGLGMYTVQLADAALRKQGILPDPPKPAWTLSDIPVVKAFTVRYPSASAQSIQDFYDNYERNKIYHDTWNARMKEGDLEGMLRMKEAGGMQIFANMDEIKKALDNSSKEIRDLWKNPKVSPEHKRQLIDQIYYGTIMMAQEGNKASRKIDEAMTRMEARKNMGQK